MKLLPSTLSGWLIFYLFLMVVGCLVFVAATGKDLPQMAGNVVTAVVSGYLGFLKGSGAEPPSDGIFRLVCDSVRPGGGLLPLQVARTLLENPPYSGGCAIRGFLCVLACQEIAGG